MNFEKEDFNEYGVRINNQQSKPKNSSNLNLSVVVAVTVLFSVFNFVVGYMIGKFLGTPKAPNTAILDTKITNNQSNNYSEIIGIPSSKNENTKIDLVNNQDEINIDLDEEPLIKTSPEVTPSTKKDKVTPKTLYTQENTKNSLINKNIKQDDKKELSGKKEVNKSQDNKSSKIKYFIQVSSNERKDIAQNTLNKLKSLGINGFIQETEISGKKVYRVRIGEFYSYEEATKILDKARKINNNAFLVVSK
ncbi:MAG: SPOR domain-containing protein [Brevinematia bacterium]